MTVPVAPPANVVLLPLSSSSALPPFAPALPMVNAEGVLPLIPKTMPPMPSGELLPAAELIAMVVVLLVKKFATSVLVVAFNAPGKLPAPVLQLFSAPAASHNPLVGEALHVAEAACEPAGMRPKVSVTAESRLRMRVGFKAAWVVRGFYRKNSMRDSN